MTNMSGLLLCDHEENTTQAQALVALLWFQPCRITYAMPFTWDESPWCTLRFVVSISSLAEKQRDFVAMTCGISGFKLLTHFGMSVISQLHHAA
jgi:hypothetical protein